MAVGVALSAEAGVIDGATLADAGDDILQNSPLGVVIEHISGHDGQHPRCLGCFKQAA